MIVSSTEKGIMKLDPNKSLKFKRAVNQFHVYELDDNKFWKNENSPYTPVGVELFMVKGPLMMPEERSSSDPRWKARAIFC